MITEVEPKSFSPFADHLLLRVFPHLYRYSIHSPDPDYRSLYLRNWNSQKIKSDITERLDLKGQLKAQEMQTHEPKQNSLVGNELGMSEVHSPRGVETRYHAAATRKSSSAQEVKRN